MNITELQLHSKLQESTPSWNMPHVGNGSRFRGWKRLSPPYNETGGIVRPPFSLEGENLVNTTYISMEVISWCLMQLSSKERLLAYKASVLLAKICRNYRPLIELTSKQNKRFSCAWDNMSCWDHIYINGSGYRLLLFISLTIESERFVTLMF